MQENLWVTVLDGLGGRKVGLSLSRDPIFTVFHVCMVFFSIKLQGSIYSCNPIFPKAFCVISLSCVSEIRTCKHVDTYLFLKAQF